MGGGPSRFRADLGGMYDVFTPFLRALELKSEPRKPLPTPAYGSLSPPGSNTTGAGGSPTGAGDDDGDGDGGGGGGGDEGHGWRALEERLPIGTRLGTELLPDLAGKSPSLYLLPPSVRGHGVPPCIVTCRYHLPI